jgi:hypothetical protein
MLKIPFPQYLLHSEPIGFLLIPIHFFASPVYSFQSLFFHFFTGLKSFYECAFNASGQGVITIRGGRDKVGPWIL